MTILKRHYLGQGKVIIWAKLVSKKTNLAQILTIKIARALLKLKPMFIVFLTNTVKKNKLGPDNDI